MSVYDRIKPLAQRSFHAEVNGEGLVRLSDGGITSNELYIHTSQIPALVIWLQEVQLAPYSPRVKEMPEQRVMMDNDRMRQVCGGEQWTPEEIKDIVERSQPQAPFNHISPSSEAKEEEAAPTEYTARWKPDGNKSK